MSRKKGDKLSEEKLNLVQKLAKIRAMSDVVTRNKKGFNYTYADVTSILANITAGMKKYGVSLIPTVVSGTANVEPVTTTNTKFTKTGEAYENVVTEMLYTAEMVYRWINDEDPTDTIDVPWFVTGSQSDPSQAFGSGMTYSLRYFMLQYFQIAQAMSDNDVDAFRSRQKEAEVSEDRASAESIIQIFDVKLKTYLSEHPDNQDEVKKFISRYAKDAKYPSIKEPTLAAKLLDDFSKRYLAEENNNKKEGDE